MPAFGTLYQRLTLPESKRYVEAQRTNSDTEDLKEKKFAPSTSEEDGVDDNQLTKKAHFKGNQLPCSHDRQLTRHQNSWNTFLNGVMPKF